MSATTQTPQFAPAVRLATSWRALTFWVRVYSWITVAATTYGLFVAHAIQWTNCASATAVFAVHLFEAPLTLYALWVAYFGIVRWAADTRTSYHAFLGFANVTNLVFFLFEIQLVLGGLARGVPDLHTALTLSIAAILLAAVGMGLVLYVRIGAQLGTTPREAA
ncbi:MAG: hypothetical protein ACKVX7_09560 [Planctomycetota bacterium]